MSWEVSIMTSRTSFFNPALFRKNLTRFSPLWAIFLGMLLVAGPLSLLSNSFSYEGPNINLAEQTKSFLEYQTGFGCIAGMLFALFSAGACFDYLHKTRSAYMMHAFPMTRDCHFVTNAFSGLCFAIVPYMITALCNVLVLSLTGMDKFVGAALLVLVKWILQYLCFYGMAVFCMHLTGNTIIGLLSYIAMSFIGWALPSLITYAIVKPLFYGFAEPAVSFTFLSPVIRLMETGSSLKSAWIYVYAVLGAALLIAAWLHYRVRHMERAGDAMVYGWAKVVFLVLFTLMIGLLLSLASFVILSGGSNIGDSVILYALCLLIGLFVGYFGAQMMLGRTIRVFRGKRFWLGYAAFAAAAVLAIVCLKADVLGLQSLIPEEKEIEYVKVSSRFVESGISYEYLGDDEIKVSGADGLALVRQIHQAALDDRDNRPKDEFSPSDDGQWCTINLVYHLKGGKTMSRAYNVYSNKLYECGKKLFSDPALAQQFYSRIIPKSVSDVILWTVSTGDSYETSQPGKVREAILADAAAGRLPIINDYTYEIDTDLLDVYVYEDRLPETTTMFRISTKAEQTLALFEKVEGIDGEAEYPLPERVD